ncbi:S8 family serine peptidase [Gorillibacterium timonense]|uniref:S8 family serine peptidase n=1 Tax=Gorillibacterium timonense TaxID=1689269 RepID=UPI000A7B930A|nr:S8 family serine peptidase [Gorillibacterium timonense]
MEKGLKKLSLLTLALGVTVSGIPGFASAASGVSAAKSPLLSAKALSEAAASVKPVISSKINTTSSDKIRVVVQLSGQPAAVGQYAAKQGLKSLAGEATEAKVVSQQTSVLKQAASKGIDLDVNYQYDTVLNGFEVTVPANKLPELAKIPGVVAINENSTWYVEPDETDPTVTTAAYDNAPIKQVSADWAWAEGYTGAGLKIGVIDSGVDYNHPDIKPAYAGGYDSFNGDDDPFEDLPDPSIGFAGTSHGTHVSGTIIGQFNNKSNAISQKGIAYGAELHVYKVLGKDPERPTSATGSTAQVLDGIERAVKDHMDVLNLSLGSDSEKNVNSPEVIALNNATLMGVTVVVANGNAGPGLQTMGSPASTQLGISVGAVTATSFAYSGKFIPTIEDDSVTTAAYSTYGNFNVISWLPSQDKEAFDELFAGQTLTPVYAGLGRAEDFKENVAGKVVLISRGLNNFVDKFQNAKDRGAKAIILFNGNANATSTDADLSAFIPGRDGTIGNLYGENSDYPLILEVPGSYGRAIARQMVQQNKQVTFTFEPFVATPNGDKLASFTSYGPNFDSSLSIKPDVSAPGVSILSTLPSFDGSYNNAYGRKSGTSMATPHVAGLALLIKQAHPLYTPFDVRAALANTADPIIDQEDYYQGGSGRANVKNAILTPALLTAVEPIQILDTSHQFKDVINYNPSASFGIVSPGTNHSKTLQVKNTSNEDLTYQASIDWLVPDKEVNATLSTTTVTVGAKQTQDFELQLSAGAHTPSGWYEGTVTLTAINQPTLHLPFVVHVGDGQPEFADNPIDQVKLTNTLIYPNRSAQNSTDLSFRFTADAEYVNLIQYLIADLDGNILGSLGQIYTGSDEEYIPAGNYGKEGINGSYIDFVDGKEVKKHLVDGVYSLYVYATLVDEDMNQYVDKDDAPLVEYYGITSFRVDNSTVYTGGGAYVPAAPSASGAAAAVVDQGLKQEVVSATSETKDGAAVVTVTYDALKAAVTSAGTSAAAILITDSAANAKLSLTAEQVKLLAGLPAKSTVVFTAGGSAVALPTSLLANAPAGAKLELTVKPAEDAKASFTAKLGAGTIAGTPVSFEANWVTASGSKAVATPNNVFIKRSFTVPGSIEPNTAGVLFEEDGVVTPVSSVFKKQTDGTTLVTVSRPGFSVYAAATRTVAFTDIASSTVASDIQALANKWIIDGTTATTFSPKANLTRAEFTALLVRALGLKATDTANFTDVKDSDWFASDVAAASEAGLIKGIGSGKFAPNAQVTREDLAVILDRALKLTGIELKPSGLNPIVPYADDAKVSAYAKDSVKALSDAGVISGFTLPGGSYYRPNTAATRDFAAAALHGLLVKTGLID